jgi:hypothetical protein
MKQKGWQKQRHERSVQWWLTGLEYIRSSSLLFHFITIMFFFREPNYVWRINKPI